MTRFFIFALAAVLVISCSSRRLEYQAQESLPPPKPLVDLPQGVSFGNSLELPPVYSNSYSYTPFSVDVLVPRPASVFVDGDLRTTDSVLLADHLDGEDALVSQGFDSRGRPAVRTELPIEHVARELQSFLSDYDHQQIDPNSREMAECALMYQLSHLDDPLFLCVQVTLRSVYIAAQADEEDDHSLDQQAEVLLNALAESLF